MTDHESNGAPQLAHPAESEGVVENLRCTIGIGVVLQLGAASMGLTPDAADELSAALSLGNVKTITIGPHTIAPDETQARAMAADLRRMAIQVRTSTPEPGRCVVCGRTMPEGAIAVIDGSGGSDACPRCGQGMPRARGSEVQ